MNLNKILNERTKTSFNISIATGLFLESLFLPTTDRYDVTKTINKIDITKYKKHYINIYTLIRNIIGALPSTVAKTIVTDKSASQALLTILQEELSILANLYENSKCNPILYIPDRQSLSKLHNYINPISYSTYKYNIYLLEQDIITILKKDLTWIDIEMIGIDIKLPRDTAPILITTHHPVDLFNVKQIPKLHLLESHTGKLKDKHNWSSKYHKIGKRDLSILPFTEKLFYILGDNHTELIKSAPITIRTKLYDIALDNNWTTFTSDDKIDYNLSKDRELYQLYKDTKTIY